MQIELLLENYLQKSQIVNSLIRKLNGEKDNCLKEAKSAAQSFRCNRDSEEFESYLKQYKKQFVDKGEAICLNELKDSMKESMESRRKCVTFYMKSFNIFENNVKQKLASLVNKLDYSEL